MIELLKRICGGECADHLAPIRVIGHVREVEQKGAEDEYRKIGTRRQDDVQNLSGAPRAAAAADKNIGLVVVNKRCIAEQQNQREEKKQLHIIVRIQKRINPRRYRDMRQAGKLRNPLGKYPRQQKGENADNPDAVIGCPFAEILSAYNTGVSTPVHFAPSFVLSGRRSTRPARSAPERQMRYTDKSRQLPGREYSAPATGNID